MNLKKKTINARIMKNSHARSGFKNHSNNSFMENNYLKTNSFCSNSGNLSYLDDQFNVNFNKLKIKEKSKELLKKKLNINKSIIKSIQDQPIELFQPNKQPRNINQNISVDYNSKNDLF